MEMTIHNDKRIIEIWLTNSEKDDNKVLEKLKEVFQHYADKKYLVAVFESGAGDLYTNTLALLQYNREQAAEKGKISIASN